MNSRFFRLYRIYSILFHSSNVGNFFLELNSKRLSQSSGKEKESHCLVFVHPQNMKLGIFRSLLCSDGKENNYVQKSMTHGQSCCFANLNLLLFCCSRWRCCCRCVSSLMPLHGYLVIPCFHISNCPWIPCDAYTT